MADDPNLYSYGFNSPLNYIDPTGMVAEGASKAPKIKVDVKKGLTSAVSIYVPEVGQFLQVATCFSILLPKIMKNPIVFIHGWKDSWTRWTDFITKIVGNKKIDGESIRSLAKEFENEKTSPERKNEIKEKVQNALKKHNIFIFDYSDQNQESPEVLGEEFAEFLKENKLNDGKTNVVSHSMGALVTREAVQNHGITLNKFAMIAPPNQGSGLAKIPVGMDNAKRYMNPSSEGLQDLNNADNIKTLMENVKEIMIFAGEKDRAFSMKSARLPNAEEGQDYQIKFYNKKQVPLRGAPGQHNTLCSSIIVQVDIMRFLYGYSGIIYFNGKPYNEEK